MRVSRTTSTRKRERGSRPAGRESNAEADMIMKVKEAQPEEYSLLREGQFLFPSFHLAADEHQTRAPLERRIKGIAYETIRCRMAPCPA